jgi:biotin carboxyl carrier protein
MPFEIKLRDKIVPIEILKRDHNHLEVKIDNRTYRLDIHQVEHDIYSIIYLGESYDLEVVSGETPRNVSVGYECMNFDFEIIDPQSKYFLSRNKTSGSGQSNTISSPMPGKVVKIAVSKGQEVKEGATMIVISAMKMESEYKAPRDLIIKEINVSEGDVVEGNKPLIVFD